MGPWSPRWIQSAAILTRPAPPNLQACHRRRRPRKDFIRRTPSNTRHLRRVARSPRGIGTKTALTLNRSGNTPGPRDWWPSPAVPEPPTRAGRSEIVGPGFPHPAGNPERRPPPATFRDPLSPSRLLATFPEPPADPRRAALFLSSLVRRSIPSLPRIRPGSSIVLPEIVHCIADPEYMINIA